MTSDPKYLSFPPDFLINQRYRIIKPIGKGSFGEVFLALDIVNLSNVAIKIESNKKGFSQLTFESKVYRYLADGLNIPHARLYNIEGDRKALVMELLGPSLEEMHRRCHRKFSLKTVCILADKMIILLEYLHLRSIIHRDIKPDNFLTGLNANANRVYIVDFGLAKQYCISRVVPHVKYNNNKCMVGTARYASINAHLGIEQSRRDDLESLGYVLLYFLFGQLPWQGISGETKHLKYDKICERKLNIPLESLCRNAPNEFVAYFNYVRRLRFDEKPDYSYLRQFFRQILRNHKLCFDSIFDWSVPDGIRIVNQNMESQPNVVDPPYITQVPVQMNHKVSNPIINKAPPPILTPPPTHLLTRVNKADNFQNEQLTPANVHPKQKYISSTIRQSDPKLNDNTLVQPPMKQGYKNSHSKRLSTDIDGFNSNHVTSPAAQRYNLRSYKKELQKTSGGNNTVTGYTSKRRGTVTYGGDNT